MLALLLMIDDKQERDKLEALYTAYVKDLYRTAYSILHDHHEAEDIIQNAFINLSKHLDKISEIHCNKTKAYLVIIVRNLAIDRYRERKKIVPTDFMCDETADNYISLEDNILNLEKGRDLALALSKIRQEYADVLALKYYYGFDNAEIGQLINVPTDYVSLWLHRGKAALKKLLSEGGVGNE